MARKPNTLLALIALCGLGRADVVMADGPPFIGHVPKGTIELVGITYYPPTNKSQWWQPDGSPTKIGPFRPIAPSRVHGPMGRHLTFLVRFENMPDETSTRPVGGINPSTSFHCYTGGHNWLPGSGPRSDPCRDPIAGFREWEATSVFGVVNSHGASPSNKGGSSQPSATDRADVYAPGRNAVQYYYQMFAAGFLESAQTTDLRVGVNVGEWETVITRKPDGGGESSFNRDGQEWPVKIYRTKGPPGASANTTRFIVASPHTYGLWNKRLVAVTGDGSEHAASIGYTSASDLGDAVCDLPLSSITELRLQVRPYRWVEFDNISLQPGQTTQVQVVSPDAPVNAEK